MSAASRRELAVGAAGAACLGVALGAWVVLDPYVTGLLRPLLPLYLLGNHVLAFIPWELTIAGFALLGAVALLIWVRRRVRPSEAALFSVLFLVLMETVAMHSVGPLDLGDVVVGGFVGWVLLRRFQDNGPVSIPPSVVWTMPMLAFAFLSVINGGIKSFFGCATLVKGAMLALVIPNVLVERRHVMFFAWTMIAVTAASSVFAIFQELVFLTTGDLLVGSGVEAKALKLMFENTSFGRFFRVNALNVSYKHFAFLLMSSLLLALTLYIYRRPDGKWARRLLVGGMAVSLVALGLTFSKDAYLGLLCGLALVLSIRWPALIIYGAAASAAGLAVLLGTELGADVANALSADIHWGEIRIRLQLARDGLHGVLNQDMWIGRGVHNSVKYTANFHQWPPHNNFIIAAAEIGVFGLLAYLIIIGQLMVRLFGACVRARDSETFAIALGMASGVVSMMVSFQFHAEYALTVLWMYLGLTDAFLRTTVVGTVHHPNAGVGNRSRVAT